MTKQDVMDCANELSELGLDSEMLLRMDGDQIEQYFSRDNFIHMWGECDFSDVELSLWRTVARGQQHLLQNMDKLD